MNISSDRATARCIVFERMGKWADALRRAGVSSNVLTETRSFADAMLAAEAAPASVLLMDVTGDNLESALKNLKQLSRLPQLLPMIGGSHALSSFEPFWWSAGAMHIVRSTREIGPASRIIQRRLARFPEEPSGPVETIRRRLPWTDSLNSVNDQVLDEPV